MTLRPERVGSGRCGVPESLRKSLTSRRMQNGPKRQHFVLAIFFCFGILNEQHASF
jgi:hypothetical protein